MIVVVHPMSSPSPMCEVSCPAKLSPPRIPDALGRARLFSVLDGGADLPLAWISGPPGSGKTTLVATWLDARGSPAFWYSADPSDSDPGTTFTHLSELCRRCDPVAARSMPIFSPDHVSDLATFARLYFRRFFAVLPAGARVVIDNHHEAACDTFDLLLKEAISEMPRGTQLVVASRSALPPPLSRLIANRLVVTVDWDSLRFSEDETEDFLERLAPGNARNSRALHELSGGWAAGLVLLSRTAPASSAAGVLGTGETLDAYFRVEVLETMSPDERHLLLTTSAFPQFTVGMAMALAGNPQASATLESLCSRQFFTERRAGTHTAYRYHDLFRDYLQRTASATLGEARWNDLLTRAAEILSGQNEHEAAVECLRKAHQWRRLGAFVSTHARDLLLQGRSRTVTDLLADLPPQVIADDPWLDYWQGLAQAGVDAATARVALARAYERFVHVGDVTGQVVSCSAIVNSHFFEWSTGRPEIEDWLKRLEVLVVSEFPLTDSTRCTALAALVQGLINRTPGHLRLPLYAREGELILHRTTNPDERLTAAGMLMYYFNEVGAFDRSDALFGSIRADLEREAALPMSLAVCWYKRAYCCYFVHDVAGAQEAGARALDLTTRHGLHRTEFGVRLADAMRALAAEDADSARIARAALQKALDPRIHQHFVAYHWIDLWTALVRNELTTADRVWQVFSRMPDQGIPIYATYNHAVVWYLVQRGQANVALDRVDRWRQGLVGLDSDWVDFNLLAMEAVAADANGDEARLDRALRHLLRLGRLHRYRNLRTWIPQMVTRLCSVAWQRGIETEYVRWMVTERKLKPPEDATWAWPRAIEVRTLGSFELLLHGRPVTFNRKTPKRPLTLLKLLVGAGPAGLSSSRAGALLWPDLEGDAAQTALRVTLHRLRKLLGDPGAVQLSDGQIVLDHGKVWVDAFAFQKALAGQDTCGLDEGRRLYRGSFLPGDEAESWSVPTRERLRTAFTMLVRQLAQSLEREQRFDDAIACYRSGIAAEPLTESLYQGLMQCYLRVGMRAEGAAVYRQLRHTLSIVLGIPPSPPTEALARQLLAPS